jgi:hypothetical protein
MPLGQIVELLFEENAGVLGAIAAGSIAFSLVGAALGPFILARLPEDYFTRSALSQRMRPRSGYRALLLRVLRNIAGWPLLLVGIALLVLPGQGVLTIIAALALMDFPMKKRLLHRLLREERIRRALDWLRRVTGKPPFLWD